MNYSQPLSSFALAMAIFAGVFFAISPQIAEAQQSSTVSLPADTANWINSAPISVETLKGKAAYLCFFEEG